MRKKSYPNHHKMKQNRLIKLKEANSKCEVCGEGAYCVHHVDGSVDNHALENLAVICKKCHGILHADRIPRTSKYIRKYGMTLKQMAQKYGGSSCFYYMLEKDNKLQKFLNKQPSRQITGG